MEHTKSTCKKVTKAAETPLPPSPTLESKKPQSLTIKVTSSVELDFDAWRGFSHTNASDYNEVEEYETALKSEWDMLLSETHGKLEWEDDESPDDDMIKFMLEDYDYCALDPPPKMTEREKAIIAKYEAKIAELTKKSENMLKMLRMINGGEPAGGWDHYSNGVFSHTTSGPA